MNEVINSPIRWAGSKKKLLNEMLDSFEKDTKIYIEPFLGSGVVLINLLNNKSFFKFEKFYVNDINSNIINFFNLLKSEYMYVKKYINRIIKEYNNLDNLLSKEKFYYNIRESYNSRKSKINAIYFFFLMKAGYNGVYRENSKGKFNVPFGKKEKISINFDDLKKISELIQDVEFFNMEYNDFLEYLNKKKILKNSFIYCDPPYLPEEDSINKKQELYTKTSFDHERFLQDIRKNNNCKFVISMIESNRSNEVYGILYKYMITDIIRTINPKKIFKSTEVLFSNYQINEE